jgi:hypothetical protein
MKTNETFEWFDAIVLPNDSLSQNECNKKEKESRKEKANHLSKY